MANPGILMMTVLGIPWACLMVVGFCVQWQSWQVYHRIGNYKIGLVTFFTQLSYPGINFPGPNVLEAQIAAQPADLRAYVNVVRHRIRWLRRASLFYVASLVFVVFLAFLVRKLSL